jgi:hypothetical protein
MEMIPYITMEVTAHDDALNNRTLLQFEKTHWKLSQEAALFNEYNIQYKLQSTWPVAGAEI